MRPKVKVSWIVYPAGYEHSVGNYHEIKFLKDAFNKAKALGPGSEIEQVLTIFSNDGSVLYKSGSTMFVWS